MAKIIGNTTATPNPRPDWDQTDAAKADYIKNKPNIPTKTSELTNDSNFATLSDIGYYTPSVTDNGNNTITISFTPSSDDMPAVDSVTFNAGDTQTLEEMLQGFSHDPGSVKAYVDSVAGEDGGYYTPSVVDNKDGTITISFTPSESGMTQITSSILTLPKGDKGDPYTLTEADKATIVSEAAESLKREGSGVVLYTPQTLTAAQQEQARANLGIVGEEQYEFVDSVEDIPADADTSKKYVIDGYIYAYKTKTKTIEHNANDGSCALNKVTKWNSVADHAGDTCNGALLTPKIAVDNGVSNYMLTIKGLDKLVTVYYTPFQIHYYAADGTQIESLMAGNGFGFDVIDDKLNLPVSFNVAVSNHPGNGTVMWANTAYIRIRLGISTEFITDADIANLVINLEPLNQTHTETGWFSTGVPFSGDQATQQNSADIVALGVRMNNAEEKIENLENLVSGTGMGTITPLFNKLGLIGDSLTNQEYQKWQDTVVNMLNIPEWHKNAITGSWVADYGDYASGIVPFVLRWQDTPEDCDCIVIMGGTNDGATMHGESMGEVGVINNNTYKGAYSTIIEGLLTRNPATRIMLMTPPRYYSIEGKNLNPYIGLYAEATREVAKHYGLPCLDLYDLLGWNKCTAEWCSWDWSANDNVHFSKELGPRIGRMVANFIRNNY